MLKLGLLLNFNIFLTPKIEDIEDNEDIEDTENKNIEDILEIKLNLMGQKLWGNMTFSCAARGEKKLYFLMMI